MKTEKRVRLTAPKVSIARCKSYERDEVTLSLKETITHLGGISKFISPSQRVCLKVNLLSAAKPEKAITTHPA
jgi:uncharacterized protein (DUF362 family)